MLGSHVLLKRSGGARRLVLSAAAKINLALEVLGRREDGYHEVATVMQAVDLSDRLVIEDAEVLELRVSAPDVPSDGSNLVARAARALRETAAVSRVDRMVAALRSRRPARVAGSLHHALEGVATAAYRQVTQMKAALLAAGALGAGMSGSGLTVFGVARSFDHARQIRARVARGSWSCWAVRAIRGPAIRMRRER